MDFNLNLTYFKQFCLHPSSTKMLSLFALSAKETKRKLKFYHNFKSRKLTINFTLLAPLCNFSILKHEPLKFAYPRSWANPIKNFTP